MFAKWCWLSKWRKEIVFLFWVSERLGCLWQFYKPLDFKDKKRKPKTDLSPDQIFFHLFISFLVFFPLSLLSLSFVCLLLLILYCLHSEFYSQVWVSTLSPRQVPTIWITASSVIHVVVIGQCPSIIYTTYFLRVTGKLELIPADFVREAGHQSACIDMGRTCKLHMERSTDRLEPS